ncbi:MAG: ATP-binding protein [Arcobacteraceae bacterium]|nr:ATP-binding protein [Arcobacteraceae bacterium]
MINNILDFWNYSIKRQLIFGITFLILLMFIFISFHILYKQKNFLNEASINQAKNRTNLLANNSSVWVMANDYIGLQEVVDSVALYNDELSVMVVDLKGKVLAHSDKSKVGQYLVDDISVAHIKSLTKKFEIIKLYSSTENHFIEVASPILYKDQLLGYVRNRLDNNYWINSLEVIKNEFFIFTLIAIIFSILFAYISANTLTRNLYNLIDVTKKIKNGEKNIKADENVVKEIQLLSKEFNSMIEAKERNEQAIIDLNENLEKIVKERTKELNLLNENLEQKVAQEVEKNREKDTFLQQQSRLAALGEMIGNIAHQWRQPLSAITTSVSALSLKEEFGILEPNDIKETNDSVMKNAQFLTNTIENFRNFFQKDQPEKEFMVAQTINNTLGIIKASYNNHFIVLDTKLDDSIEYFGSENLLAQVLLNILSNAKDALIQNQIVDKKVTLMMYKEKKNIKITIKDNAGGIPKEYMEKVFDPYFTTKHKSQGTGLGLYMSTQIIKNHFNGILSVSNIEDDDGFGACFMIEIPIKVVK